MSRPKSVDKTPITDGKRTRWTRRPHNKMCYLTIVVGLWKRDCEQKENVQRNREKEVLLVIGVNWRNLSRNYRNRTALSCCRDPSSTSGVATEPEPPLLWSGPAFWNAAKMPTTWACISCRWHADRMSLSLLVVIRKGWRRRRLSQWNSIRKPLKSVGTEREKKETKEEPHARLIAERKPLDRTVVDASFQQGPVLLQQTKLIETEKCVIETVRLSWPSRPRRHGHRPQIQIVADGRLQFMVHWAFSEASRQILA